MLWIILLAVFLLLGWRLSFSIAFVLGCLLVLAVCAWEFARYFTN